MSDLAFARATRPRPQRILRVPLLDYSVGHELLLQREENLLLMTEEYFNTLTPGKQIMAIMRAVQICSRTWEQNKKADKWVRIWAWLIRKENFALAIADFRTYRQDGSSFPKILDPDTKDSRNLGSPFMARLLAFGKNFGEKVYDLPLGMLQWLYFAEAEFQGNCKVENDLERQIREETAQHIADHKREHPEQYQEKGESFPRS